MAKGGSRSVGRSASTGRFVGRGTVARWPGKTVTQTVGGSRFGTTLNRSASTGRFVSNATVRRNPGGTVTENR